MSFKTKYGPWALVTGGARGLGAEFARQLAGRGLNIILLDQSVPELHAQTQRIQSMGVEALGVVVDLAQEDFLANVNPTLESLEIGLLINCAAQISLGPFLDLEPDQLSRIVAVNCRAPLLLAGAVAPRMKARGRGGIIFLSSLSAYQGAPLVASYASTKAFNHILGESLWAELREFGLDVLALAPGPTDTWGYRQTSPNRGSLAGRMVMTSEAVVAEALTSLGRRPSLVPGPWNKLSGLVMHRLLPKRAAIGLLFRSLRELYPELGQRRAGRDTW